MKPSAAPGSLTEEVLERVVVELRERFGELGRIDRVGRSTAWSTAGAKRRAVQVVIEERDEMLRVRIEEPLRGAAGRLFGGIIGGVGGGTMWLVVSLANQFFDGALVPFVVAAWLLTLYTIVRTAYGRMARRRGRELVAVTDRIVDTVGEAAAADPPEMRVRVAQAQEHPEDLHEADPDETASEATRSQVARNGE